MGSVLAGLGVGSPEEETRGGGLSDHHDHQPGHAEGRQGRLSTGQERVNAGPVSARPPTSIPTTRFILAKVISFFLSIS